MRLSVKAFGITTALVWAVGLLFIGLVHLANPAYGGIFLNGLASVYWGFHGGSSLGDVALLTLYGLVDAGIGGMLFAWLYNALAGRSA